MSSAFESSWWRISVPRPWKAEECEHCVEFTQPEGLGALHISAARKTEGLIEDAELVGQFDDEPLSEGDVLQHVRCGDFEGYFADFVDNSDDMYCRKWFVACGSTLIFATYTCPHGEEKHEMAAVEAILSSLRRTQ